MSKSRRTSQGGITADLRLMWIKYHCHVRFEIFTAVTMKNAADCCHLLTLGPGSRIFLPWRWTRYVPRKRRFTEDLHGATSHIFISLSCLILVFKPASDCLVSRKSYKSPGHEAKLACATVENKVLHKKYITMYMVKQCFQKRVTLEQQKCPARFTYIYTHLLILFIYLHSLPCI
jgi:hypothetical protein